MAGSAHQRDADRRPANERAANEIEQGAFRYLAARDRTEAQFKRYLAKLGASPTRVRLLTTLFRSRGYLDDAAFAMRWAQSRLARRPMGRARLEAELLKQGVDPVITSRTLDQVYRDRTERELADCLLMSRCGRGTRGGLARDAALLRRHGFSEETIEAALEQGSNW
jgi:regulatory protein